MKKGRTKTVQPWQPNIKQELAIDLLAQGLTAQEVADRVGVQKRQIERWKYECPEFIELVRSRVRENSQEVRNRIVAAGTRMVEVLVNVAENSNNHFAQIKAAEVLINCFSKFSNWEIDERLERVEERLDEIDTRSFEGLSDEELGRLYVETVNNGALN